MWFGSEWLYIELAMSLIVVQTVLHNIACGLGQASSRWGWGEADPHLILICSQWL